VPDAEEFLDDDFALDAAPTPPPTQTQSALPTTRASAIVIGEFEPLDPVRIMVWTGARGSSVLIDGESISANPASVILEAGTHEVIVQNDKGSESFTLAAGQGDQWCFTTKGKGFKTTNCPRF
jgi:hypothetical protein